MGFIGRILQFDDKILSALARIGGPSDVEKRWGHDILVHYENAYQTSQKLKGMENPMRTKLVILIRDLLKNRQSFRIFCHRDSREHFESLADSSGVLVLPDNVFIHTVDDYRKADLFDVLLKVGPLRSRGWGSVPDAVITAPRFDKLIQLVWSGCDDEPGFGFDPVSIQFSDDNTAPGKSPVTYRHNPILQLNWKVLETRLRDNPSDISDVNDLEVFTRLAKTADSQCATLIQVDDAHGILYPPLSRVLSFDDDPQTIDYRLPGETLQEGMFLILPVIDDVNLAGLQAEEGPLSRTWKESLITEYRRDPEGLANRLWDAGLMLLGLSSRIEHWCIPATSVIPAPRQMDHFEILIRELGIDFDAGTKANRYRAAWWKYAWFEVRRSRGQAIQEGRNEQQLLDEQVRNAVKLLNAEIWANLAKSPFNPFDLPIPVDQSLTIGGVLKFHKIMAIEEGFLVPSEELKILCELDRIERWRA